MAEGDQEIKTISFGKILKPIHANREYKKTVKTYIHLEGLSPLKRSEFGFRLLNKLDPKKIIRKLPS
jgi:hypothetical protein